MNRFLKLLVLVIPFSFLMGTWWGLRSIEKRLLFRNRAGTELKLLYRRGYLPPQVLTGFEEKTGIQVVGFPMETDQALWEEISERPANYDLIQLFSYMAQDPVGSQIFADLDKTKLSQISKVSVDFRHLPYDPEFRFLLPLNWGLNGFLWNTQTGPPPAGIKTLLSDKKFKGRVVLLPQQVEIFSFLEKSGALLPEWLEQEKWEQLAMATKDLLDQVSISSELPTNLWKQGRADVVQVANGPASEIMMAQGDHPPAYWLPEDKTNLWISLIGVSKATSHSLEAHDFLSYLLEDGSIQNLVSFNSHATAIKPGKPQRIRPMQLPDYLRQVTLDRIQLQTDTASLTPIWYRTLSKALPDVFPDPRDKRDEPPPPPVATEKPLDPKEPKSSEKPITQIVKEALPPTKPVSKAPLPPPEKPKPVAPAVSPPKPKPVAPAVSPPKPKPVAPTVSPPKPKPVAAKPEPAPPIVVEAPKPQTPKKTTVETPMPTPTPAPTAKSGLRPVGTTTAVKPVGTTAPAPAKTKAPSPPVKKPGAPPTQPEEADNEEPTTEITPANSDANEEGPEENSESSGDDSPF